MKKEVYLGQAVYSKAVLRIYDLWVLGISNSFIWKCSTKHLIRLYQENITNNHLDVGVGTGYFLRRCTFPQSPIRLGLMDLNTNSLQQAGKATRQYQPEIYQHNVFEKPDASIPPFSSISLNYLLHCLPGNLLEKEVVLKNLITIARPQTKIFGATILAHGLPKSATAKALMNIYNKKGIFHNRQDTLDSLHTILQNNLNQYAITTIGCVAMFSGTL